MNDFITLLGTETISSAASTMSRAAEEMKVAAGWNNEAVSNLKIFMDDWLMRFEDILIKDFERKRDGH